MGLSALTMLTSVACGVYVSGGFVAPAQTNIPFSTLNLAIVLGIVVTIPKIEGLTY